MAGKSVYDVWVKKYGKEIADQKQQEDSKKKSRRMSENNPMAGKKFYDIWVEKYGKEVADQKRLEHIQKCKIQSSLHNPMAGKTIYDVWLKKYGKEIADQKRETHRNNIKKAYHEKSDEEKDLFRKQQSESQKKMMLKDPVHYRKIKQYAAYVSIHSQGHFKQSGPERKVEQWLLEHNVNFISSIIMNKYQYDFLLKDFRVLVEVQGDYWHTNPQFYGHLKFLELRECLRIKIIVDLLKAKFAIEHNFGLIRIWENEINSGNFSKLEEVIN
jgi:very-short-patch-repair endonuclease